MQNVALEFKKYKNSKDSGLLSESCKKLIDIYTNCKVYIPVYSIDIDPATLEYYYKNKVNEFIDLINYLEVNGISDSSLKVVNKFLQSCSKVEAEVFIEIFTRKRKTYSKISKIKEELGMCLIQEVPQGAREVTIDISEGTIRVTEGGITPALKVALKRVLSDFTGTLLGFFKDDVFYVHDFVSDKPTKERLIWISALTETKNFKVITPTFHLTSEERDVFFKEKKVLIKPILGTFSDVFKN